MAKPISRTGTIAAALFAVGAGGAGCSGGSTQNALGGDVHAIIFLQRPLRNDGGNVFDYTSYKAGGRLVTLEPPAADGKLTVLTSDPMFKDADIMSYDVSFDAKSVVFSARLSDMDSFHIYSMNIDGTNVKQLIEGPNDFVYPIFTPGQQILFMTNKNVEPDANQFRDEYERATTAQVGTMNIDGSNVTLGARNVSHRVSPMLLPNGRVVYTEWRHMGPVNDGHLRMMDADMTNMREAFGGEQGGEGGTNSYLKARYVQSSMLADGTVDYQLIAVATSRDRTLQAGKLFLIDLNGTEAKSTFTDLTPLVPGDRTPSPVSLDLPVGRYYDAEPVGDVADQRFLVSWSDGPVESEVLDAAHSFANFGLYVLDGKTGLRSPVYDDLAYWDVQARPIKTRPEPAVLAAPVPAGELVTTVGALNVYDSSVLTIPADSVVKARLIEGFSGEEGVRTFGTTEFDGQSMYGEIDIAPDKSFAAKVPGNVPFHIQLVDKFAMSIANESIWVSGRAGEQRVCGGCHEDRSKTTLVTPGVTDNFLRGAVDLYAPRAMRKWAGPWDGLATANYNNVRGVPWDKALQPIFDAKCTSCHDGDATKPGNPTYTVMDMTSGLSQTFTFDLRGQKVMVNVGEKMTGSFSASYLSIMGLGELLGEHVVTITGTGKPGGYAVGGSARDSDVIKKLNPPQQYPAATPATRAFPGVIHPVDAGGMELAPGEYYLFILNLDMGGQFFFRENLDSAASDPYQMGGI
ncbi:MAG TPA: hypothetical protein VMU50_08680 [Polyangia bacterium]|nr:hypothetical protein [Polyangia bacterium]